MTSSEENRGGLISRALARLRFPQLFLLLVALFLLNLFIPDPLPVVDEAILALLTIMLSQWKKSPQQAMKPPEKNVTPPE